MKLIRRCFGLDFPDPQVGQVWRSRHSGRLMRVSEVRITDSGALFIYVQREYEPGRWGIGDHYAIGLGDWRWMLRDEVRVLITASGAGVAAQP